jgi:hypothetical protein
VDLLRCEGTRVEERRMILGMDEEWRRLQGLYAAMSDNELLRMAESKGGLTEVAQEAVEAEMSSRGLVVEAPMVEAAPEVSEAVDDPLLVELMTFSIAMDAETALRALDDRGIPVRMEPAMRQMVEGGPKVKTSWLTIFVERTQREEAQGVLRARMGLFPVLAADEVDHSEADDEALMAVGTFDVAEDVEVVRKALTDAGVWFRVDDGDKSDPEWGGTLVEVRVEDWDRALEVVEAAFGEE